MATKAGKTVSGEDTVLQSIRSGTAYVVIVSREASERSKKTFKDKCTYYGVPCVLLGSKEELGRHLGKISRTVAAITDEGLGRSFYKLLEDPKGFE
ncbi:MAG: ribosomal L7Ae/L30e/S12e/Gadd45 family protein [Lachnospiraceae bacterium]|nr:ribosomal L7Ae/L30e/S12e/Gadd45 family protein [Lachnospiraceae bacterium]